MTQVAVFAPGVDPQATFSTVVDEPTLVGDPTLFVVRS